MSSYPYSSPKELNGREGNDDYLDGFFQTYAYGLIDCNRRKTNNQLNSTNIDILLLLLSNPNETTYRKGINQQHIDGGEAQ